MNKKVLKELRDWGIFFGILAIIYFTGAHTLLQRLILSTGIMKPATDIPINEQEDADYQMDLMSLDGKTLSLSELKGKVIFINFWATWCPPCIAEMPDIHNLYKETRKENIVFLMISMDEDPAKAKKFIQKKGFSFPVYFLNSSLPPVYRHNSIPRTYVISPDGKIAASKVGMASYNNRSFKEFLKKLNKP